MSWISGTGLELKHLKDNHKGWSMKRTLSICLLFCLLASSTVAQVVLALETGPAVVLKAPVVAAPPAIQNLPDVWALESADDELLGKIEKQVLGGVAAAPELLALTCQLQPGFPGRCSQPHGGIHHPPFYILLNSYRS